MSGSITDVPGIRVGHWTNSEAATGCTVVLVPDGTVGAYRLFGGAPGSRELELLGQQTMQSHIHAFVLTGGSAYGLASADGVMTWLEEQGTGFQLGPVVVPLVPAAVIFDLTTGDPNVRPRADDGYSAAEAAGSFVEQGSVGAGTGATCAKWAGAGTGMKGGIGTASRRLRDTGAVVGALVVCNAIGDVIDNDGSIIAGSRTPDAPARWEQDLTGQATVLAIIATNAKLAKGPCGHIATMGGIGISRAVRPAHTTYDGDIVFCAATGEVAVHVDEVGAAAADAVAEALRNGVRAAKGLAGVPGLAD